MRRVSGEGRRDRFPWRSAILMVLALGAIGVIIWGVEGSRPARLASVHPVPAQYVKVSRGNLDEHTTVTATLSVGEIVSLVVPASPGRGAGGDAGSITGSTANSLADFAAAVRAAGTHPSSHTSTTATPTTTPVTTSVPTTPTTAVPLMSLPGPPSPTVTTTPEGGPTTTVSSATTTATTTTTTTTSPSRGPRVPAVTPQVTSPVAAPRVATTTTSPSAANPVVAPSASQPASTTRVVTSLAPVGVVLKAGDEIFAIDGRPTILMTGSVPAWRTIDTGTTDGADVHQLETTLAAKGFDDDGAMTVDDHVDAHTIAAIDAWQASLDIAQTGEVALGEVVFEPTEVTVVALNAKLGAIATPGDALLDIRKGSPYVDISTDSSWVSAGSKVSVRINGSSVTGTVSALSGGIARVDLPASGALRDGASVTVTLTRIKVADQLLVPAISVLVSDLDGPTIAVVEGGQHRTVEVDVVASANDVAAVKPRSDSERLEVGEQVVQY